LLTGTTPLTRQRVKAAALLEVLRLVREEEPPRPSTRLSTTDELPAVAATRGVDPAKLTGQVRGELDWIVMRALEKDRARRYETANALAADVGRYLAGDQVQAVPPSAGYRLRKFARRNRYSLAAAGAVALGLVAAVVGLAVSNSLIQEESRAKETEREGKEKEKEAKEQAFRDLLKEQQAKLEEERQKVLEAQGRASANESWRRAAYFLKTAMVLNEWRAGNRAWAAQLLQECPQDLRGWEWNYLNRLCSGQSRDVPIGEPKDRWIAAFSPDLTRVVTVDDAGRVHMHDATTGQALYSFLERVPGPNGVRFSADGKRIATSGHGRFKDRSERAVLQLFNTTGQEFLYWKGSPFDLGWHSYFGVDFSPDGKRIALLDLRGNLMLYDLAWQRELWQIEAHPKTPFPHTNIIWFTSAAFSPDGTRIATVSEDHTEGKVWDAETGREVLALKNGGDGFNRVLFSPKGTWIVTVGRYRDDAILVPDTTVRLWDSKTGRQLRVFQGGAEPVTFAAVSPDETRLATGTQDGTVVLWDLVTGQKIGTYHTRNPKIYAMRFSPDGRTLATATRGAGEDDPFGRMIQFWDATRGAESRAFRCSGAHQMALSPDGRYVLAAARDAKENRHVAVIWDADTGEVVREFGNPKDSFSAVAYSPDGKTVAIARQPEVGICAIELYDPRTGQLLRTLATPDGKPGAPCDALAFSSDGTRLASGAQDQVVRVWEVATGRQLWESKKHGRSVSGIGFSRDGKRLVSATGGIERVSPAFTGNTKAPNWPTDFEKTVPVVKVWEAETGREQMSLDLPGKTQAVAISPDGKTVAVGVGRGKTFISINFAPGSGTREIMSFEDSSEGDKSVRLYEVPTGKVVGTLKGHSRPARTIAFSPDGKRIATAGGSDNAVKLWDATGEEILTLGPQAGIVHSVAFSADGTRIVSGSLQEARLWDATPLKK
jgi:WD40 repeat protein